MTEEFTTMDQGDVTGLPTSSASEPSRIAEVEKIKPNKKYVCFEEAHNFAKTLDLKTRKEWRAWVKGSLADRPQKPSSIPAHPDGIYKTKGWQGWKFWLGTADKGLFQ